MGFNSGFKGLNEQNEGQIICIYIPLHEREFSIFALLMDLIFRVNLDDL